MTKIIELKFEINDEIIRKLVDMVADLDSELPRWVNVKDQLPEDNSNILTYSEGGGYATAFFCYLTDNSYRFIVIPNGRQVIEGEERIAHFTNVTHWMSLPNHPKENE